MIQTVSFSTFRDAFRLCRPSNFSHDALGVLFDYLEELEDSTGQQIELDVIALCCDYSEQSPLAIAAEYDIDTAGLDDDETLDAVLAFLHDETIVVGVTEHDSIVYCSAF